MKTILMSLLAAILIFVVAIGVILLIAIGLGYVLQYIQCDILVYAETFFILGLFMVIILIATNGGQKDLLSGKDTSKAGD